MAHVSLHHRLSAKRLRVYQRRLLRNEHVTLLVLAVAIGAAAGGAEIMFRWAYSGIQWSALGFWGSEVVTLAQSQPWWRLLLVPALGGLVVGVVVNRFLPEQRPHAVPDVIAAAASPSAGLSLWTGIKAAFVSALSIGAGASVGREGPMVHLGATLGSVVARGLGLHRTSVRTLLGCGAAAGVAASFNAPIAGVFFALEVVIGHYALHAFAPIVIASVTGTVVSRWYYGDFPAFVPPESYHIVSQWEFLAFALLGLVSALIAVLLALAVVHAPRLYDRLRLPHWTRPGVAGLAVGAMAALGLPHVVGVGYEATSAALSESYGLELMVGLIVAKILATGLCLGAGFGGGVFSPSIFLGAMTGGAFGFIATSVFPEASASYGAYTIVGMGAVAGAVLGAPISTILIVFELTSSYELTIGVMVATVIASEVVANAFHRSLFLLQLERRGINIRGGEEDAALHEISVANLITRECITARPDTPLLDTYTQLGKSTLRAAYVLDANERLLGMASFNDMTRLLAKAESTGRNKKTLKVSDAMTSTSALLTLDDDLAQALDVFGESSKNALPVIDDKRSKRFKGIIRGYDLMRAYHKALREVRDAEHG
jgi:CIC family chloride channel protein